MTFGTYLHVVFLLANLFYLAVPPYLKHPINGMYVVLIIQVHLFPSQKFKKSNADKYFVVEVELLQLGLRNSMMIFLVRIITNPAWINHTPFRRKTSLHTWVQCMVGKKPIHPLISRPLIRFPVYSTTNSPA